MSIALGRRSGGALAGAIPCMTIYEGIEMAGEERRLAVGVGKGVGEQQGEASSCSSSIGRNSDCSGGSVFEGAGEEAEVQSQLKGPLDTMDALEDCLPIRRGISNFYRGKSKSFACLADVSFSSSMKDLAKPESPYNRKRKNLMLFSCSKDRNFSNPLRSIRGGGVCKRFANSSQSTLTLSSSGSNSNSTSEEEELSQLSPLPPPHPQMKDSLQYCITSTPKKCSWSMRSYSMADLQTATSPTSSGESGVKSNMAS